MSSSPIAILLVDDEPRNLDALESILSDPAYRLLRADHADQALRLLLEQDVAAIVLDIKMPVLSGLELAQIIKNTKRFRDTPIVFLTAYLLDDQHVIAGYGVGAVDYLTKPVNPQILRHKIAVFAELFRKRRELAELNEKLEERVKERTAELEKSEAALRAAAMQKDEFLAVLAHELRNPLAPLRTGVGLLLRQQAGNPAATRTLTTMNRQLDHIVRLIDDLLDISRISRGILELKRERVDVGAIVDGAVDGARSFFERRKQILTVENARELSTSADPIRVAQVLTNLLHNASKFTPEGGAIRVAVAREGSRILVRVADDGSGIPADHLEKVFDMFTRIDRPGIPGESGLGIGLALSRRLAEMHGGTVTAASPGEGHGTTFTLALPLVEQLPAAGDPARDHERAKERAEDDPKLKILVIEDNEDVASTLAAWLQELGHEVWIARTGQLGVELVADASPNVVLCDLGLPGMGGLEVCRSIRSLDVQTQPVMVALTGWGREEDRRRTTEAGFDHHLVKPIALDKLSEVFRSREAHVTRRPRPEERSP